MIRLGLFFAFMGSMALICFTDAARANQQDDGIVIAIERAVGLIPADRTKPIDRYRFTVANDGSWEFKPTKKVDDKKGKLGADEVKSWVKDIEDGGLYKVKSNPSLGAADEPYMDITLQTKDKKTRVRIRLGEKLAQTIEKKIVETAKLAK